MRSEVGDSLAVKQERKEEKQEEEEEEGNEEEEEEGKKRKKGRKWRWVSILKRRQGRKTA